ncbi:cytochrome P450 [Calycina marina]|uniref:Cytochrome P450 n=1 Tax=Calycina marina TaxID=1763456 RepID=A0A9P7Z3D1_9HELO|nr:cytochrome P450 [Calycina marina]
MLEEIFSLSPKALGVLLVSSYVVYRFVQRVQMDLRIRKLGGKAVSSGAWLPWDIDFIYKTIAAGKEHKVYEQWLGWFEAANRWTIEGKPGGQRVIFTADPENIKAILATQFGDYGKGEPFHADWSEFLGDSIFTTDADQWHNSRQLIRPMFIKNRVSDLEIFETHTQALLHEIARPGTGREGEVDVSDLFFRYTLDAATHFLLGKSVDSLDTPEQDFADAFAEVQHIQNVITRMGPLNWMLPRGRFRKGLKVVNDFVNQFIEQALALSPKDLESKTKTVEGFTFLHSLASFTSDRKVLRDQLVAILLAGRDTTACGLSWIFYEIARNPEIVKKLCAEIEETVGLNRLPTYEDLKGMKYINNVIKEALRIYPVVPFNIRLALKDCTLPHGGGKDGLSPMGILKNDNIGYSTLVMQRREDLYPPGSEPLRFIPERWETWQPEHWQYIPFNGGPRICIGQQFALTEMAYTLVRIFQQYDGVQSFMPAIDGGNPCMRADIVLQPGQGVKVKLRERKAKA